MQSEVGLTKTEKRVLQTSIVMMLLFAAFFLSDGLFDAVFGASRNRNNANYIADVVSTQNDVRQKGARTYQWAKVPGEVKLSNGDAVFTGEKSKTTVQLRDGVRIEIGEQSLIKFQGNADEIADLKFGSIHIAGSGDVKIRINGDVVTIPLNNGPVDLQLKDGKYEARAGGRIVAQNKVSPNARKVSYAPVLLPIANDSKIYWKLYDLYDKQDANLVRKAQVQFLPLARHLEWKVLDDGPYKFQMSSNLEFKGDNFESSVSTKSFDTQQVYIGANFWRVSSKTSSWSQPQQFTINPEFLPNAPTVFSWSENVPYFGQMVVSQLAWTLPRGYSSTLMEISENKEFPIGATVTHWTNKTSIDLPWTREGVYYVRLRGLDDQLQVGVPTSPIVYSVANPPLLGRARLPKGPLQYSLDDKAPPQLQWRAPAGTVKSKIEIYDIRGKKMGEFETAKETAHFKTKTPGAYSYRVTAIDRWNRPGHPTIAKPFALNAAAPEPQVIVKEDKRKVASEPQQTMATSVTQKPPQEIYINQKYNSSVLAVEGASFAMLSSMQDANDKSVPVAATMAIRWTKWWDSLGMEWSYKTKVFDYNSPAREVQPTDFNAVAAIRTNTVWNWFGFLRELQIAGLFGVESYRDPGASAGGTYTPGYNVVKAGFSLEFPVSRRWQSGGEAWYGKAQDSSTKYEISGHMNYFLKKDWSMGVGYRAHAFEAESLATAPRLPFREAYGEGYTTLQYHY